MDVGEATVLAALITTIGAIITAFIARSPRTSRHQGETKAPKLAASNKKRSGMARRVFYVLIALTAVLLLASTNLWE